MPRLTSPSRRYVPVGCTRSSPWSRAPAISKSIDEIPEPHAFTVRLSLDRSTDIHLVEFQEHDHGHASSHRDNNMRAAIIHVLADAAVSVLVIVGLLLGRFLGWAWMDPVAGLCGAIVIAVWSYGLLRDTGAILLDMKSGSEHGGTHARDDRSRWRSIDRPACPGHI